MKRVGVRFAAVASVMLTLASWRHWLPVVGLTEMLGVLAGAWGVWLTAEESVWNWPVGIAGSLLFAALFFHTRLFGSMGMQLLYVVLGAVGWYWWRRGGEQQGPLPVSRAAPLTLLVMTLAVAVATPLFAFSLWRLHDAAPVGDALAPALNLAAQFLVTKKRLEHWHISILADIVSITLFLSQGIYFFSAMLAMHLGMCVFGLWQWRRSLVAGVSPASASIDKRAFGR